MENPESLSDPKAVDSERVLFDKGGLKVTQHRFVVERTVYAMRNITSIQHEIHQPPTPPTPDDNHYHIWGLIGLGAFVVGILSLAGPLVFGVLLLLVSIPFLIYGGLGTLDMLPDSLSKLHVPPQAPPTPPAKHTVKLTSAAGEKSAFSNTDGEFVAEVLSALNQAMAWNRPD